MVLGVSEWRKNVYWNTVSLSPKHHLLEGELREDFQQINLELSEIMIKLTLQVSQWRR